MIRKPSWTPRKLHGPGERFQTPCQNNALQAALASNEYTPAQKQAMVHQAQWAAYYQQQAAYQRQMAAMQAAQSYGSP